MTKKVIVALVLMVFVIGAVGTITFFVLRPAPTTHLSIELNTRYYIMAKRAGLFHFPDGHGMPKAGADNLITLAYQDRSYAVFENNWRTFRIHFDRGGNSIDKIFIVHDRRNTRRRGFTANVTHIYNGRLQTMRVTAVGGQIYLRTTATSLVTVATAEFTPTPVIEVLRTDSIVFKFAITPPSWRQ